MKITMTKPSWSPWLTFGKVYDVEEHTGKGAWITDDDGDDVFVLLYDEECAFMNGDGGMWIVVDVFEDQGEENA